TLIMIPWEIYKLYNMYRMPVIVATRSTGLVYNEPKDISGDFTVAMAAPSMLVGAGCCDRATPTIDIHRRANMFKGIGGDAGGIRRATEGRMTSWVGDIGASSGVIDEDEGGKGGVDGEAS
ncbi:hypothetical protein ACLOJK_007618, partial [Asimina triloba]